MTWFPIWMTTNKVLIAPLVIPSLSYGLFAFIAYGNRRREVLEKQSLESDKQEMKRWSLTLCDPNSPNYQPFTFINK